MSWDEISTITQIIGGIALGISFLVGSAVIWTGIKANQEKDRKAKAQDERIAELDLRRAEAERDLAALNARVKARTLTEQQKTDFVNVLKKLKGGGLIDLGYSVIENDDGLTFVSEFLPLFKEAGWTIQNEKSITAHLEIKVTGIGVLTAGEPAENPGDPPPPGEVSLTPTLITLRAAFKTLGMDVQFINWRPGKEEHPEVVIGSKPHL